MPRLSQETIALIGVGIALGALILTTTGGLREEIQAVRAEARADRERAERRLEAFERRMAADQEKAEKRLEAFERRMAADQERAEKRLEAFEKRMAADQERAERRMADFEREIIRLTEQQGTLGGLVEGLRHRQPVGVGSNDPPG